MGVIEKKHLTNKFYYRYWGQKGKKMEKTIPTFSKEKLTKALEVKQWDHRQFAEKLSEHLGRPISCSQAKGWIDGIRPGSDMLMAIAQVLNRSLEWFYE